MRIIKYLSIFIFFTLIFFSCNFSSKNKSTQSKSETNAVPEVVASSTQPINVHMSTYVNSVYRYHISYPDNHLIPQGESDSGDGQVFVSKDKLCELRVYRDTRDILYEGAILKKSFREDIDGFDKDSISNSEQTDNFYIIEGKNNSEIFHQKTFLRKDNLLVTAIFTYKPEVSDVYSPLVAPIFSSIH